jgi:S-DNA-T family DNA segregation ATPase FtsK/SpoIIIE
MAARVARRFAAGLRGISVSVVSRPWDPAKRTSVALPTVPTADSTDPSATTPIAQMFMPMIGMVGFSVIYLVNPSPTAILMGGVLVISTLASGIGMGLTTRRRAERKAKRKQLSYLFELDRVASSAIDELAEDYRAAVAAAPAPSSLPRIAAAEDRSLIRSVGDPAFLYSRIGLGPAPIIGVDDDDSHDITELDPASAQAQRNVLDLVRAISDWPIAVSLAHGSLFVFGSQQNTRNVLRALVLSSAASHTPTDLSVLVAAAPRRLRDWGWLRWLPHAPLAGGRPTDAAIMNLLALRASPRASDGATKAVGGALIIIADDLEPGSPLDVALEAALHVDGQLLVIRVESEPTGFGKPRSIHCTSSTSARVVSSEPAMDTTVSIDAVDDVLAERIARSLAGDYLLDERRDAVRGGVVATETMAAIDRLENLVDGDPEWLAEGDDGFLRATLGRTDSSQTVMLDLQEPAKGGDGPHGVIVGATGSGKSELLRTLVLSLAARHNTDDLSLLLADFKGGATFIGLSELPHVCGTITNLESDGLLVTRAQLAIEGELQRRQELLAEYGKSSADEYREERRLEHPYRPPLPHLVVIVDEFSELLGAHPGFAETFASVGRLGRSLGLHLLLASQRLDEGKTRGLESHLSYRIALRTFNVADSMAVIGSREAFSLPTAPGAAIMRTGGDSFTYFQSDYVTAPVRRDDLLADRDPIVVRLADGRELTASRPLDEATTVTEPLSLVDIARATLGTLMPRSRQIWLEPLPARLTLGELFLHVDAEHQMGALPVPIGLLDEPRRQAQSTVSIDLGSSSAVVAIAGAAQTGKTTLLQSIIVSSGARYAPDRLGFMILDQGGGLFSLADAPNVMACHGRGDRAGREHLLAYLRASLAYRSRLLRERSLGGADGLRAAWTLEHTQHAGPVDLVLIVDDYGDLFREDDEFEGELRDIMSSGPGLGIHVIMTVRRWGELRTTLSELVPTKIELSLNDIGDSIYQRRERYQISKSQPGRALGSQGLLQVALPFLREGDTTIFESVGAISELWGARRAPRLRPLPELVELGALMAVARANGAAQGVILGAALDTGQPVQVDFRGESPNLLVRGPTGSGKSSMLRLVASQVILANASSEVELFLVDPRMKLSRDIPADYLTAVAASSSRAIKLMEEIKSILVERLPHGQADLGAVVAGEPWQGRRLVLIIDDAHMMPRGLLSPIDELLPFAHLLGLSVIASMSDDDAAIAGMLMPALTNLATPTVQFGARRATARQRELAALSPPGRGTFLSPGRDAVPLQAAWIEPALSTTQR